MITNQKIKTVLDELKEKGVTSVSVFGGLITAKYFNRDAKMSLTTKVFDGVNYIPQSVRDCLKEVPPMPPTDIQTYIAIDEGSFRVFLHYLGNLDKIESDDFKKLIEQFAWIAEEWRYYLEDCDKKDLIHVLK